MITIQLFMRFSLVKQERFEIPVHADNLSFKDNCELRKLVVDQLVRAFIFKHQKIIERQIWPWQVMVQFESKSNQMEFYEDGGHEFIKET